MKANIVAGKAIRILTKKPIIPNNSIIVVPSGFPKVYIILYDRVVANSYFLL
jgi:hypothetical protein